MNLIFESNKNKGGLYLGNLHAANDLVNLKEH